MNKQLWELYKNSDRGKETIDLFSFYLEDTFSEKYILKVREIASSFGGKKDDNEIEIFIDLLFLIGVNLECDNLFILENEDFKDYSRRFIESFELSEISKNPKGIFEKTKTCLIKKATIVK